MSALIVSQALLWIALVALALITLALIRQVGILHERVAPMGALVNDHGPEVGEMAPKMDIKAMNGDTISIGGANENKRKQFIFFVSPACPICKKLLPIVHSFSQKEQLDVIIVGDGSTEEQEQMIAKHRLNREKYLNTPHVGMAFHVGKLPYAVLIDHQGIIRAKGLVNSREHLESLVIAEESGYASIQDYLSANHTDEKTSNKGTQESPSNNQGENYV